MRAPRDPEKLWPAPEGFDLRIIGCGDGMIAIHEADCREVARARREKWPVIYPIDGRHRSRLKRGECPGCQAIWSKEAA